MTFLSTEIFHFVFILAKVTRNVLCNPKIHTEIRDTLFWPSSWSEGPQYILNNGEKEEAFWLADYRFTQGNRIEYGFK